MSSKKIERRVCGVFYFALLAGFTTALTGGACGDGADRGDSDTEADVFVPASQVQRMCDSLDSASKKLVFAGKTRGERATAAAGPMAVQLVEREGGYGGTLDLALENGTALVLFEKEDVPLRVLDAAGKEVEGADPAQGEASCAGASRAIAWIVSDTPNRIEFGPTSVAEVSLVLEVVDTSD